MMRTFLEIVAFLALAIVPGIALASSITCRVDEAGNAGSQTVIVRSNGFEIWGIGVNAPAPTFRAGYLRSMSPDIKGGAYLGAKANEMFVTPVLVLSWRIAGGNASGCLEYQHHLSPLPDNLSVSEVRVLWPIRNVEIGPAGHASFSEGNSAIHYGLAVNVKLPVNFYVRWCPFGDKPETLRMQVSYDF